MGQPNIFAPEVDEAFAREVVGTFAAESDGGFSPEFDEDVVPEIDETFVPEVDEGVVREVDEGFAPRFAFIACETISCCHLGVELLSWDRNACSSVISLGVRSPESSFVVRSPEKSSMNRRRIDAQCGHSAA